jgi:DNA-binding CsgD family transcriptional regulator
MCSARDVLLPTYVEAAVADWPVVHRIMAVANNVFLSYRRLTILYAPHRGPVSRATSSCSRSSTVRYHRSVPVEAGCGSHCLSLAASGRVAKQMAAALGVSEKTVELYLARARRKLGARTTTQAVATALLMALLEI